MFRIECRANREQERCEGCEDRPKNIFVVYGGPYGRPLTVVMRACRMCAVNVRTKLNELPEDMRIRRARPQIANGR